MSAGELTPTGGLPGADSLCESEATALPGSYRALLATGGASAASRFSMGGAWQRVDGMEVTRDLVTFEAAIDRDASGVQRTVEVWTGSMSPTQSNNQGGTCEDWTIDLVDYNALAGSSAYSGAYAFAMNLRTCDTAGIHVYCFQQ